MDQNSTTSPAVNGEPNITRQQFMDFFRSDDYYELLSTDDCIEVFQTAIKGSSDITAELLNDLISDYSVSNLEVRVLD